MPLLVDDVVELAGDLVVHAAEVVAVESVLALLASRFEQLAQTLPAVRRSRSRMPSCIIRRRAALTSPWYSSSSVSSSNSEIGVEVEPALGAVPPRVREPLPP